MGTRDSETSPKRTDQSEAIESNRKWQSIDLIPPPKVPTTTELKDEQQDFPVQVGVARPGWRGQIQSRSAIRQGRVPREQRKHHWSCVPDADGGLERWHHGQVRDLGYCWPGRFNSLAPMYYRGAQAALVVYDITNDGSFARAKAWVKELQTQGAAKMIIALVGNKSDLEDGRRIRADEARAYAEENGVLFMETSAKTAQNVSEIFEAIANTLPKKPAKEPARPDSGFVVKEEPKHVKKGGCCS